MKSTRMFVLWLVAAAWLFTGVGVQAQSNPDAVLTLDYVGADASTGNKTDDAVTGGAVAGTGTTVVIEVFGSPIATGLSGASFKLKTDVATIKFDSAANAGMDTPFAIVLPGTDSEQSVGSLMGAVTPEAGYLGRLSLVTVADVTGVEFSVEIEVEIAVSASDKRTISQTIDFNVVPPEPMVSADVTAAVIPRGGVSPAITVTAANFAADATVTFTVTSAGTATISETDNGDGTLTLTASGSGSATADVTASDGTTTTAAVTVAFSEQVPAELAAFGGSVLEESVALNWTTVSQTNNAGWQVMRSTDGVTYEVVSDMILGAGTSDAVMDYGFEDTAIPSLEKVYYRLDQIDLNGTVHSSAPIEVILGARFLNLPTDFETRVYPNPFNPATTIAYDLPNESAVSIVIYDALGQEVRRLVTESKSAGRYTVRWDALDNLGRSVGSGVYIAKVEAGQFSASQKMLLLK